MLSILIPTYNYSAFSLVEELENQATEAGIIFEIIVLDDGSTDADSIAENSKINELKHCRFERNGINLGRAGNLNQLGEKAKYEWLLFMDCDTFPKNKLFLQNYLKAISESKINVFFGGICYKKEKPETTHLLRWKYGSKREEISLEDRIKNPYGTTLTSNILIRKILFETIQFDKRIAEYGYEDLVFIQKLKAKKQSITPIDNATFHLNYETSEVFLAKTKKALETLKFIEDQNILEEIETKIQKTHYVISKLKLNYLTVFLFKKMESKATKNLFSNNPSLFVFDLYKLGYYTTLKVRK